MHFACSRLTLTLRLGKTTSRVYELVPAKASTFRLRTFAPWFLRVGKRNLTGLCVITMRNDSLLIFFFDYFYFPSPDAFYHFFLNFSATSILPVCVKVRPPPRHADGTREGFDGGLSCHSAFFASPPRHTGGTRQVFDGWINKL